MTSSIRDVSLRRHRRTETTTAIGITHKKFGEHRKCSSEDMIPGRQTHRHRQTDRQTHAHHNTGGVTNYLLLLLLGLLLLLTRLTALFSGTTQMSRYQKRKTNPDFTEARDSQWQWHQLGHMQVCTSLQTDNHASTPPLSFLQAGCNSCRPTNSVKALKAHNNVHLLFCE